MKIKRSFSKKQLHKWTKLGVGLAAVTVLGGLVEPVDVPLLSNCTVEAQELTNQSGGEQALPADTATVTIELENTGVVELVGGSYRYQRFRGFERLEIHLQPGETYTLPTYVGYKLINFKNFNEITDIAPEDAILSYADFTPGQRVRLYYDYLMTDQVYDVVTKQYVDRETVIPSTTPSINSPTDTPPAQPTENPVDQSITIKAVYTEEQIEPGQKVDVLKEIEYTLKPGESVVLEPLTFEGWTSRVVQESQTVTYEEAKARPNKEYYFYYIEEGTTPTEKPIETPAETPTEKQVISSEIRILNVDGATYWKGEGLDKAVVGTTTVELEVGGDLTIPATVVPEGYEITDVRFNVLSTGVKELPHTWTYEKYKNYTSAPMSVPEIDILVKPVSSPATPVTPPAETPSIESPVTPPADSKPTETSPVTNQSTQNQPAQTGDLGSQTDKKPVSQPAQESQLAQPQVKQATVKPAPTSQSQAKTLPATGEVSSVLHLTGLGLLGLAGLVVKRRSGKSS